MTDPVILACGPDTVYYTIRPTDEQFQPVRQELDADLQMELELLKQQAQQFDEKVATRWAIDGKTLYMRDKGGSQFKWIMDNEYLTLSVGRGKKTGVIGQVRLSSEFLWHCEADLGRALSEVHVFLTLIYGQHFTLDLSRIDLCADVLNLDLSALNVKECFISRAVLDDERPLIETDGFVDGPCAIRRRWKKLSGLSFGKHTSAVSAVIYNKTDEIKYHSKEKTWFYDIYRRKAQELGIEYTEDMTVWRVEARFTRPSIREFPDVSGAYDVLAHVRDLWTYAVGHPGGGDDGLADGWLRYVTPTEDTNRARWPVHPDWEVIQQAFDEPEPVAETDYEREEREKEELLAEVDAYLEAHPMPTSKTPLFRRRKSEKVLAPAPADGSDLLCNVAAPPVAPGSGLLPTSNKPFIRTRKRVVNVERGIAQIAGMMSTLEAWRIGYKDDQSEAFVFPDISSTLHYLSEAIPDYLAHRMADYAEIVVKKRGLYGLQEAKVS